MSRSVHPFKMHVSIFTKLMAISFSMVSVILIAVSGFFLVLVRPVWQQIPPEQHLKLQTAHDQMLVVLLVLLVVIVLVGHALLRRMIEPIRALNHGVAALGEGNFEVTVPIRNQDELGALSDAFNKMVSRVGEMVKARDQLLLDVSHELRSPLTRMKVALELCENDEHIEKLKTTVIEMETLVTELLELERLRQGRGLKLERQDMMEVLRDAIAAFEQITPGVRLEFAPPEAFLLIDADKVRSVFGNLLENACKYAASDSHAVCVKVREIERSIVVEIEDDGPGIPADDLPSIFEPFFRVDRSRSKRTGGYGLGLSLCKRIMEAHGGHITVRNNSLRGTTFELTFPLIPADANT
jgi:signal transduction histidine kinase